ncbi:MAG TPA: gliding motility protein [Pseudomonadota bacterium]|nr:gliding motility protein [Pseudomonadota bacterium]
MSDASGDRKQGGGNAASAGPPGPVPRSEESIALDQALSGQPVRLGPPGDPRSTPGPMTAASATPPRPRLIPDLAGAEPTADIPDPLALGQRFLPDAPQSRIVTRLHGLLSEIDASWDLEAQLDWLERLSDWLHRRGWPRSRRQTSLHLLQELDARTLHLELLVSVLEQVVPWRWAFSLLLQSVLQQTQATGLFTDVGLAQEPGFWREATARLSESILPRPPNFNRLSELLLRVLPTSEDARWLTRVPRPLFERLLNLLQIRPASEPASATGPWQNLRYAIHEAVIVLTSRVCALGLANDVRERMPETALSDLPFLRLRQICEGLLSGKRTTGSAEPSSSSLGGSNIVEAFVAIQDCRQAVQQVLGHLEDYGVSVDLVYRLELINAKVGRIEALLGLLFSQPAESDESGHEVAQFVADLIDAQTQHHSLRALFRTSTQQLSRKIVERTGKSGEKYITETPSEWRQMLLAGCGAGVLTAGTAVLKYLLSAWKLPAFFAGLVASTNYALSFVIIQLCHFTLATKQPSMTAAALAGALSQRGRSVAPEGPDFDRLLDMISRITRSQMASALGNLGAVIPAALLCDWLWRLRTGHNFLSPASAAYTVHSMHPLIALPFAILTGVYLWLSSIAAGWLENWTVYHHLPAGIAGSRRIRRWLGVRIASWLGRTLERQVAGIGGVVTLGILLGMSPVVGQFFGLPTEVRHVTLSTGSLALSAATDVMAGGARALLSRDYLYAALGILLILAANFGVSFMLALWVALRARGVRSRELFGLVRSLLRRLWHSPLEFVFPVGRRTPDSPPP